MRYAYLSREMKRLGHRVHLAITRHPHLDVAPQLEWLDSLQQDGFIDGYSALPYVSKPKLLRWVENLLIWPAALRPFEVAARTRLSLPVLDLMSELETDALLISDRHYHPVLPELNRGVATLVDWGDSLALAALRALEAQWRLRSPRHLLWNLRTLVRACAEEACWGRRSAVNLAVSPVDERALAFLNRRPETMAVIYNGVPAAPSPPVNRAREPGRLIFTGNMSFGPNCEGAAWFIDRVMPRLRAAGAGVTLAVAGQLPLEDLQRRSGPDVQILGFCPDMLAEISRSRLYVAPMISGSGFKNKVVEALLAGTFVVGTSIAVEFLPPEVSRQLLVADSPDGLARQIVTYLESPDKFDARLEEIQAILRTQFQWSRSAGILAELAWRQIESRNAALALV